MSAEGRMATVKPALHGKSVETGTRADQTSARKGLVFERRFTDGKTSAFDMVEWEKRTALIGNEKGATIFRQEGVEVPKNWSQTATNIVTSKYFHGKPGTSDRENSVRQLIESVNIAAAEHHVIGNERLLQLGHRENYFAFPFIDAESLDPEDAEKVFDNVAIPIRKIAQLERKQHVFQKQRRAEPSAEAEK